MERVGGFSIAPTTAAAVGGLYAAPTALLFEILDKSI
jgi:hypothetical protein